MTNERTDVDGKEHKLCAEFVVCITVWPEHSYTHNRKLLALLFLSYPRYRRCVPEGV